MAGRNRRFLQFSQLNPSFPAIDPVIAYNYVLLLTAVNSIP